MRIHEVGKSCLLYFCVTAYNKIEENRGNVLLSKVPTRKCLEQLAWEICWCLPNEPRQLDGTANVPIYLATCTAGSMRQNSIWVCPYLCKAHSQKDCPDLMTSGGNLTSIRTLDVSKIYKMGISTDFCTVKQDLRKDDLCSVVVITPSHI